MNPHDPHIHPATADRTLSRRRFLEMTAAVGGGAILPSALLLGQEPGLRIPLGVKASRVVLARSPRAVAGPTVHRLLWTEMLQSVMTTLTGQPTIAQAWRVILKPDDVIGLKFNRSGQTVIGTTSTTAEVLIQSIIDAGWPAERIVCIEAPAGVEARMGTMPARQGYQAKAVDFDSGIDELASVVDQVTVLIDVPYLKTHNIAGMTCSLKKLSHGLVKHPARYHRNGCSPYIADIVARTPIRNKLKLCLVDALRVVYDGGPEAAADTLEDSGVLIASFDPVAVDLVGLMLLNETRSRRGLEPIAHSAEEVGYLAQAHRLGLGLALWHGVDLVRLAF